MGIVVHAGPPRSELGQLLREDRIASLPDEKERIVQAYVDEIVGRGWAPTAERSWAKLCLDEAISNAMLHGNEGDPQLTVRLVLWRGDDCWHLVVSDEGEGFDPADLPDAEGADALLREHGRGIVLMREWLDELCYYDGGATALLSRRIASG